MTIKDQPSTHMYKLGNHNIHFHIDRISVLQTCCHTRIVPHSRHKSSEHFQAHHNYRKDSLENCSTHPHTCHNSFPQS